MMRDHHSFSPSLLEHCPRPAEKEIRIKEPGMNHDARTHTAGGTTNG